MLFAWLMAAGVVLWGGNSQESNEVNMPHLRSLDPLSRTAVEVGMVRSPTFSALVQTINQSEFVVYVESSRKLRNGMEGCLVHGGAGLRYLRVVVKTGLSVDERIEVVAHELQHVREVIEARILNDPTAMQALFSRIGTNKHRQGERQQEYETNAARNIAVKVARELRASRR